VTDEIIPNTQRPDATASTWLRVVQLIEAHTDVKQVRLNMNEHSVSIGFYDTPSEETLDQIKNDVRAALSGQWDVSITPDDKSPTIHLHKARQLHDRISSRSSVRRTASDLETNCVTDLA